MSVRVARHPCAFLCYCSDGLLYVGLRCIHMSYIIAWVRMNFNMLYEAEAEACSLSGTLTLNGCSFGSFINTHTRIKCSTLLAHATVEHGEWLLLWIVAKGFKWVSSGMAVRFFELPSSKSNEMDYITIVVRMDIELLWFGVSQNPTPCIRNLVEIIPDKQVEHERL